MDSRIAHQKKILNVRLKNIKRKVTDILTKDIITDEEVVLVLQFTDAWFRVEKELYNI